MQYSVSNARQRALKRALLFVRRLVRLPFVLRPRERIMVAALLVVIGLSLWGAYFASSGIRPANGGAFTEGFVGQARFVNPVLATSDIDTSLTQLIYSGLTKLTVSGMPEADLADTYESNDGGKTYIFHLRGDVYWHDGQKFSANDVMYTTDLIKDPATNSPFYETWKDIAVEAPNDSTVIFHLKDPLATFPWIASVGIVPSHVDKHALNTTFVGTGPYRYSKVRMQSGLIESVLLVRNTKWYGARAPYIDTVEMRFYKGESEAKKALAGQEILAFAGEVPEARRVQVYSIPLAQTTAVYLNSQSKIFTDIATRKKLIASTETFASPLTVNLVVDTRLAHDQALETLLNQWKTRNVLVIVTEQSLDIIKKTTLPSHTYDAVVLSVESGPQIDLYPYWHSSQGDGGLNFARIRDGNIDKLVLDQRKTTDLSARDAILQQISSSINDLAVVIPLSQASAKYSISKSVHPTFLNSSFDLADRFALFDQWYIKTRR